MPLPMPTQPETLTATRVATSAIRSFFIGIPSAVGPCDETQRAHCNTNLGRRASAGKPQPASKWKDARLPSLVAPRRPRISAFQLSARMSRRCCGLRQHCDHLRVIRLTKLDRAEFSSERRRSGNRHPLSFQPRAAPARLHPPGPPPRRRRSGCVARASCVRARRGER